MTPEPEGLATVIPMSRAARRRREREAAKAQEKAAKAPSVPALATEVEQGRLDIQDVHTVLLGAAGWSVGHPPFPPGAQRDAFRGACDRLAAFLDLTLGWPEDPSPLAVPQTPTLIIPGR